MHKFVFIGFVLLVVTLAGCKELQPVIVVSTEKTVTFDSAQFLNKLVECNEYGELVVSWFGLAQLENDSLRIRLQIEKAKSDSLEANGKHKESRTIEKQITKDFKGKLNNPITATIKETTETKPCDPKIIKIPKAPFWAYASAVGNIILLFTQLITFFIMYRLSKK